MKLTSIAGVLGAALYLYGAAAFASPQQIVMPDYQAWFQIVLGLLVAVIGAYAKGVSDRVTENKREIDVLRQALNLTQVSIATEHHTKAEANEQFHELKSGINALHRRLDFMRAPSVFPSADH
jgi:cytochrome c biogenesis protein CcdA